uniref:Ig-like domain-containing protein n=1 Tax=Oncorhynchus mykiss TaxID=8022 RepID=A0A8K9V5R3_ONCMY
PKTTEHLNFQMTWRKKHSNGHVTALEGGLVTLSCNYTTSSPSSNLFWYVQLPRDSPQYVLRRDRYSEGSNSDEFKKRFDSRLNFTSSSVPLTIQRLQVSDSALYFCALRPTVTTGDSVTVQTLRVQCFTSEWYYSSPTDLTVAGMEPWLRNAAFCYDSQNGMKVFPQCMVSLLYIYIVFVFYLFLLHNFNLVSSLQLPNWLGRRRSSHASSET